MHSQFMDRNIMAMLPGDNNAPIVTLSSPFTTTAGKGDFSLLATQFKKREEDRKKREEGGFTTKAMRDLEKMKQTKVYSHTQLRICFPDGCRIDAKFLPSETVGIIKSVVRSTFLSECQENENLSCAFDFDLYVVTLPDIQVLYFVISSQTFILLVFFCVWKE